MKSEDHNSFSDQHSTKDHRPTKHSLFKVLLNPVLTKIDVNISDFIIAVGVVLDVTARSEHHITEIQRIIVP